MSEEIKQEAPQPEPTADMKAVMFLKQAIPEAVSRINSLTGVQAKRVLATLVETPFENNTPEFTTREAMMLYRLCTMISDHKFVLLNAALEARKNETNNPEQPNSVNEENKEQSNG